MINRILIVGVPKSTHVGLHLVNAARSLGLDVSVMNSEEAFAGPRLLRAVFWRFFGHRPIRLGRFSRRVLQDCRANKPDIILTTGFAPLTAGALQELAKQSIPTANFLTDDPWNPAHHTPWFMRALADYQHVFTPRHANEKDLSQHGVRSVSYLPFAYSKEDHHPPVNLSENDFRQWGGLISFIGGADADRASLVRELLKNGLPVGLWGGYWKDYVDLAAYAYGYADAETCRKIVAASGANLCLVRRANRDGHSMRSYEMPAIGGSLLMEQTEDHESLFGSDHHAVRYFDSNRSLVDAARQMLALGGAERAEMKRKAREIIVSQHNSYEDRLRDIIMVLSSRASH